MHGVWMRLFAGGHSYPDELIEAIQKCGVMGTAAEVADSLARVAARLMLKQDRSATHPSISLVQVRLGFLEFRLVFPRSRVQLKKLDPDSCHL
jgi:hypothetical protein